MTEHPLDLHAAGRVAYGLLHDPWKPSTPEELDAALRHHDRILDAMRSMLRYGGELRRPTRRTVTLQQGLGHPAYALLSEVDDFPRVGPPSDRAPSEILLENPAPGGPWRDLDRELLLADHTCSRAAEQMPREVRWGLVADVAALAGALALLHSDLADSCDRQDRYKVAAELRSAASASLLHAAAATLELATSGPIHTTWIPPAPPTGARVVLSADDFVPAARALSQMLDTDSLRLDANDALAIARHHAVTSQVIGRFLTDHGRPGLGCALKEHASYILFGTRAAHQKLWSAMWHPHQRPAWQARELYWASRQHVAGMAPAPGQILRGDGTDRAALDVRMGVAAQYATLIPSITAGLAERTAAGLASGHWVVRDSLTWRTPQIGDQHPLSAALRNAGDRIAHLDRSTRAPELGRDGSPDAPHRLLASSLPRSPTSLQRPVLPRLPPSARPRAAPPRGR